MTDEGVVVSKTIRGKLESHVVKVSGKHGEVFFARVLWQGNEIAKEGGFADSDEAEAKADQMRDKWFRENYSMTKR